MQVWTIVISAIVGAVVSVITAYVTTRLRMREETAKWEREFPLNYAQTHADNPSAAQGMATQFAVGVLIVEREGEEGRDKVFVPPNCRIVAGRGVGNEIDTRDLRTSRRHCAFSSHGASVFVEDLGAMNATFLDEELVTGRRQLSKGDVVRIGMVSIEFQPIGDNA